MKILSFLLYVAVVALVQIYFQDALPTDEGIKVMYFVGVSTIAAMLWFMFDDE